MTEQLTLTVTVDVDLNGAKPHTLTSFVGGPDIHVEPFDDFALTLADRLVHVLVEDFGPPAPDEGDQRHDGYEGPFTMTVTVDGDHRQLPLSRRADEVKL